MCRDLSKPSKICMGYLPWGKGVVKSAYGFLRAYLRSRNKAIRFSLSLRCLKGSGLPTDLCFGNQTSGTKPARTHLASHTYCWGTQKELQEGTSIGMEVYGGNDDSRVRTKQLTFLWKALSGPTTRWWFETLPLYKARKERGTGQIKLFHRNHNCLSEN